VTELAYLHAAASPQHARVLKDFTHKENSRPYFSYFGTCGTSSCGVRYTDCVCFWGCGNIELAVPHAVSPSNITAMSGIQILRDFVICVPQVV
jgi:hypothetical protein